jgi:hypothetical protein
MMNVVQLMMKGKAKQCNAMPCHVGVVRCGARGMGACMHG